MQNALGPGGSAILIQLTCLHARSDAAKVLQQRDAEHDRNGPEFTQLQRSHRLIGFYEASQGDLVNLAIDVADQFERKVVNARPTSAGTVGQAWQFAGIAAWQMACGEPELLFDEIEVVNDPFGRRRDAATAFTCPNDGLVGLLENAMVVLQASEERLGMIGLLNRLVPTGEGSGVLSELVDAVEVTAQRLLIA